MIPHLFPARAQTSSLSLQPAVVSPEVLARSSSSLLGPSEHPPLPRPQVLVIGLGPQIPSSLSILTALPSPPLPLSSLWPCLPAQLTVPPVELVYHQPTLAAALHPQPATPPVWSSRHSDCLVAHPETTKHSSRGCLGPCPWAGEQSCSLLLQYFFQALLSLLPVLPLLL